MTNKNKYVLATGGKDYQRLMLLNRLYNPGALAFMKKVGLKSGIKVLEIGCGTGHMAVELAKVVGKAGKVFATDNNEAQLEIARETAKAAGIENIEFFLLDLNHDLNKYREQFDFTYGRWVIEFTQDAAERVFAEWFDTLKPGGVLVYESTDMNDPGAFTYPDLTLSSLYGQFGKMMFTANHMPTDFIKRTYFLLKELGAQHLDITTNQAIAKTPEEKSAIRLGLLSAEALFKEKFFSESEFNQLVRNYEDFEASENIAGFYRNYLVSGQRP